MSYSHVIVDEKRHTHNNCDNAEEECFQVCLLGNWLDLED